LRQRHLAPDLGVAPFVRIEQRKSAQVDGQHGDDHEEPESEETQGARRYTTRHAFVDLRCSSSLFLWQPQTGRVENPSHISPHAIAAHMRFLADDALEGREPGNARIRGCGGSTCARSSRRRPRRLVSAGADARREARRQRIDAGHRRQAAGASKDCLIAPDFARETVDVSAPVVLAGFGVSAPELKYDDYRDVDARGKIVLLISGAPKSFPNDNVPTIPQAR